jgi:hypothetical protein
MRVGLPPGDATGRSGSAMSNAVHYAIPLLMLGIAGIVFAGFFNLVRRGPSNLSQRLMRWRVGLQFLAVVLLMTSLYFARG